jgi:hypothetical protein
MSARRDGEAVVSLARHAGNGDGDADADALRSTIVALARHTPVVTVDMRPSSEVSIAVLDALADAGRELGASRRTLVLSRVDPPLVRRIAEAGHTGLFTLTSPRSEA